MKNFSEWTKCGWAVLTIITVLTFSLSPLPDLLHGIGQSKAPCRQRTEADLIKDLRLTIFDLQVSNSYFNQENRHLRYLVYTTKPDHWATWLHLLDYVKKQDIEIKKLRERIRGLEILLGKREHEFWQELPPDRTM